MVVVVKDFKTAQFMLLRVQVALAEAVAALMMAQLRAQQAEQTQVVVAVVEQQRAATHHRLGEMAVLAL